MHAIQGRLDSGLVHSTEEDVSNLKKRAYNLLRSSEEANRSLCTLEHRARPAHPSSPNTLRRKTLVRPPPPGKPMVSNAVPGISKRTNTVPGSPPPRESPVSRRSAWGSSAAPLAVQTGAQRLHQDSAVVAVRGRPKKPSSRFPMIPTREGQLNDLDSGAESDDTDILIGVHVSKVRQTEI